VQADPEQDADDDQQHGCARDVQPHRGLRKPQPTLAPAREEAQRGTSWISGLVVVLVVMMMRQDAAVTVPAQDAAVAVPARDVPARDVPARDVPDWDVPAPDVATADVPSTVHVCPLSSCRWLAGSSHAGQGVSNDCADVRKRGGH
jgi:hypothetical protein